MQATRIWDWIWCESENHLHLENIFHCLLCFNMSHKARHLVPFLVTHLFEDVCMSKRLKVCDSISLQNRRHICLLSIIEYLSSLNTLEPMLSVAPCLGPSTWLLWGWSQRTDYCSCVFLLPVLLCLVQSFSLTQESVSSAIFHETVATYLVGLKVEWNLRFFNVLDSLCYQTEHCVFPDSFLLEGKSSVKRPGWNWEQQRIY